MVQLNIAIALDLNPCVCVCEYKENIKNLALCYKQLMWSPKAPIIERLQILTNKVISSIVIILIKPKY